MKNGPNSNRWNGVPPLGGSIPDMVSTTNFFVDLQKTYRQKAADDRVIFKAILANIISVSTVLY